MEYLKNGFGDSFQGAFRKPQENFRWPGPVVTGSIFSNHQPASVYSGPADVVPSDTGIYPPNRKKRPYPDVPYNFGLTAAFTAGLQPVIVPPSPFIFGASTENTASYPASLPSNQHPEI